MSANEVRAARILARIEAGPASQRMIARELGVALGLINSVLKDLERRGIIKITRGPGNVRTYRLTSAGRSEKARLDRRYFASHLQSYVQARDRIAARVAALGSRRVALGGVNELAEIVYICLQQTPAVLAGVVDDVPKDAFFGHAVHSYEQLRNRSVAGVPFDCLIITSARGRTLERRLAAADVPRDAVLWLSPEDDKAWKC